MQRRPTLSLNEWAVLGLLVEQPRHGYEIAVELEPGSEVGEVWRLPRALVYRAIGRLESLGLAQAQGTEPGRGGPPRTVYEPTPTGAERFRDWLVVPVEHLRDLRSGFLLKMVLAQRAGVDRTELVQAQRRRLAGQFTALAEPPPPGRRRGAVAPPLGRGRPVVPRSTRPGSRLSRTEPWSGAGPGAGTGPGRASIHRPASARRPGWIEAGSVTPRAVDGRAGSLSSVTE